MSGPAKNPDRLRRNRPAAPDERSLVPLRVPEPPSGLLKSTREWWESLWVQDSVLATFTPADAEALSRLATLRDLRERAYRIVKRDPVVEGSQGQPVEHPLARAMSRYDSEIRALEDRFGLTPRARLNLGLQVGQIRKSAADLSRRFGSDDDEGSGDGPVVVEV